MSTVKVTRGARLLRAHLKSSKKTVPAFAEAAGISRYVLQDALRGTSKSMSRVSVDFAFAVQKAAGIDASGAHVVPADAWCSSTLRVAARGAVGRVHKLGRRVKPATEAAA